MQSADEVKGSPDVDVPSRATTTTSPGMSQLPSDLVIRILKDYLSVWEAGSLVVTSKRLCAVLQASDLLWKSLLVGFMELHAGLAPWQAKPGILLSVPESLIARFYMLGFWLRIYSFGHDDVVYVPSGMDDLTFAEMIEYLAANPDVIRIIFERMLSDSDLTDAKWKVFVRFVHQIKRISLVAVIDARPSELDFSPILSCQSIVIFKLSACSLGRKPKTLRLFCEALKSNKTLRQLFLDRNDIQDELCMNCLVPCIATNSDLELVALDHNLLSNSTYDAFRQLFKSHPSLKRLSFRGNPIANRQHVLGRHV